MVNLNFLFLWCLRKWEQAANSSTSTDFLEFLDKLILIFFFKFLNFKIFFFFWPILFILPMHWVPPTFCLFLMNLFTYKNGSLVKLSRCKQQVARAYQGQEAYSQGVSAARTIGSSYPCGWAFFEQKQPIKQTSTLSNMLKIHSFMPVIPLGKAPPANIQKNKEQANHEPPLKKKWTKILWNMLLISMLRSAR